MPTTTTETSSTPRRPRSRGAAIAAAQAELQPRLKLDATLTLRFDIEDTGRMEQFRQDLEACGAQVLKVEPDRRAIRVRLADVGRFAVAWVKTEGAPLADQDFTDTAEQAREALRQEEQEPRARPAALPAADPAPGSPVAVTQPGQIPAADNAPVVAQDIHGIRDGVILCGATGQNLRTTANAIEMTCPGCLDRLAQETGAAEQSARLRAADEPLPAKPQLSPALAALTDEDLVLVLQHRAGPRADDVTRWAEEHGFSRAPRVAAIRVPGIIDTIFQMVGRPDGGTAEEILAELQRRFPDRSASSMMNTIKAQCGGKNPKGGKLVRQKPGLQWSAQEETGRGLVYRATWLSSTACEAP